MVTLIPACMTVVIVACYFTGQAVEGIHSSTTDRHDQLHLHLQLPSLLSESLLPQPEKKQQQPNPPPPDVQYRTLEKWFREFKDVISQFDDKVVADFIVSKKDELPSQLSIGKKKLEDRNTQRSSEFQRKELPRSDDLMSPLSQRDNHRNKGLPHRPHTTHLHLFDLIFGKQRSDKRQPSTLSQHVNRDETTRVKGEHKLESRRLKSSSLPPPYLLGDNGKSNDDGNDDAHMSLFPKEDVSSDLIHDPNHTGRHRPSIEEKIVKELFDDTASMLFSVL